MAEDSQSFSALYNACNLIGSNPMDLAKELCSKGFEVNCGGLSNKKLSKLLEKIKGYKNEELIKQGLSNLILTYGMDIFGITYVGARDNLVGGNGSIEKARIGYERAKKAFSDYKEGNPVMINGELEINRLN